MAFAKHLLILIAVLIIGTFAVTRIPALFWVSPTPQNQSAFIRSYDPMPVVNAFRSGCGPDGRLSDRLTEVGSGTSSGAGYAFLNSRKDVEHQLTVEPLYCGSPAGNAALLTALHEHALKALRNAACVVSGDRLTLEDGLQIRYRCHTRTTGVVTARPPRANTPGDDVHMLLSVHVDEWWAVRQS